MASRVSFPIFLLIVLLVTEVRAAECSSWLNHLAQEHHVFVIPKQGNKASNYRYFDLPNSPYLLAIPEDEEKNWKVETRALKTGSAFTVYNQAFGYSGEYDNEGTCLNSTGFAYNQMDGKVPDSLKGKNLSFNYDWKSCEKVKEITEKHGLSTSSNTTWNQVIASLKKNWLQDFKLLEKISETSGSSSLYKTTPPSISSLLSACARQSNYLDLPVKNPERKTRLIKTAR